MPSLFDIVPQVARGFAAAPEGYRQEGVSGVAKSFQDPSGYESTSRLNEARDTFKPELDQITQHIGAAQDPMDLIPAIKLFQQAQIHAGQMGLVHDESAYNEIFGRTNDMLKQKVRELAGLEQTPEGMAGSLTKSAVITGDEGLSKQANALEQMRLRNAQTGSTEQQGEYYRRRAETEGPRGQAYQAMADLRDRTPMLGGRSGTAGAPKLPTLADVRGQQTLVDKSRVNADKVAQDVDQQKLDDLNAMRAKLGMPPVSYPTMTPQPEPTATPTAGPGIFSSEYWMGGDKPAQPTPTQTAQPTGAPTRQPTPSNDMAGYVPQDTSGPGMQATPTPGRIQISNPALRKRAQSGAKVGTSELIADFVSQGMSQAQAAAAVRQLATGQ